MAVQIPLHPIGLVSWSNLNTENEMITLHLDEGSGGSSASRTAICEEGKHKDEITNDGRGHMCMASDRLLDSGLVCYDRDSRDHRLNHHVKRCR